MSSQEESAQKENVLGKTMWIAAVTEAFPERDYAGFLEELQKQTDRAVAVLAAAFLDRLLEDLLAGFFIENEALNKKLFRDFGALGSTAAKIDLAYSLGHIGPDLHHDLEIVNGIRNKFAHEIHGLSFESNTIKHRCKNLKWDAKFRAAIPDLENISIRDGFIVTISKLASELSLKVLAILKDRRKEAEDMRLDVGSNENT